MNPSVTSGAMTANLTRTIRLWLYSLLLGLGVAGTLIGKASSPRVVSINGRGVEVADGFREVGAV